MNRLFLVLLGVASLPLAALATDAFYINSGVVDGLLGPPPSIDASNFVNEAGASFVNISTSLPYETSNTQNYTNKGSMTASVGWRFETAPSGNGVRRMAKNFRNHPSGTITALDGLPFILFSGVLIQTPSKLIVSATNLINEGGGLLTIDSVGLMSLEGKSVNLNRGRLQVLPLDGLGFLPEGLETPTNFVPDSGIIDNYWGLITNNLNSSTILNVVGPSVSAVSPVHQVQRAEPGFGYFNFLTQVIASPAMSFVFTNTAPPVTIVITNSTGGTSNLVISTNMTIQAAFVEVSDPQIGLITTFYPSSNISNLFSTITVGLSAIITNPVTGAGDSQELYFMDRLASETNRQLQANLAVTPTTFKPSPYSFTRTAPIQFLNGAPANSPLTPNLLFDSVTMSNAIVGSVQIGYGATADIVAQRPAAVPGGAISNIAGRVLLNSGSLDLTRTRLRADSWVSVQGDHLISSSNAIIDSPLISYDLGSTNGNLRIKDLARSSVQRFGGDVRAWSGNWTNVRSFIITNYVGVVSNVNGVTNTVYVQQNTTNGVTVGYHVLILDASLLTTTVPARIHDFITHSTNLLMNDPLFVTNTFSVDAQKFTIEGTNSGVTFGVRLQNWTYPNAPNLLYFTNSGTINIPNEAHFGDDRPVPYSAFVNQGNASGFAAGLYVRSDYFENTGTLTNGSLLFVQTVSGRMEDGKSYAGGDLRVNAQEFKFRNYTHQSLNALVFTITNMLYDTGPGANVQMLCRGGFSAQFANATGKPQAGDLLGTAFKTFVPAFFSVPHTWPGNDRGASPSGFVNNLAMGKLVVSAGFFGQAIFSGTGDANGLYVDYLDLAQLSDYQDALQIDPNLVIYYAAAALSFTPPPVNGVAQQPEEFLDGQFGGHLRWVRDYAGANSSVDVVLNGTQTIQVNRALRNSRIIDSDGDGTPNFFDLTPFDDPPLALSGSLVQTNPAPAKTFAVSWMAAPNTVYQVEFRTSALTGNWQPLLKYTNNVSTNRLVTVCDTNVTGVQRFYRVGYGP